MRFDVPIGDSLIIEADARLFVSGDLASNAIGGPTHWARCRIYLTEKLLAIRFAQELASCHQSLEVPLTDLRAAELRPRLLDQTKSLAPAIVSAGARQIETASPALLQQCGRLARQVAAALDHAASR